MGKAIGIDLGTTNSCAAIVEGGKPRVITYKGGSTTIPSVFAINEKGERLVGHDAKRQAQLNPTNTVAAAKRLIGRNYHSKTIEKMRQVFTYELLEGESNEVLVKVRDQVFTLEQISAAILRKIREVAEESLNAEVDQAVITVPAYFNDRQRQAVRTAGKLAGVKVLRVLNEPTAAALAYGLGKNLNQRIAVYDLGGGTFDISIIDIKGRIFEVIATGGDTFLGGVDFDDRVMQWVLEQFYKQHHVDLSFDRVAVQRVRDAAEAAKIELSSTQRTRIHVPFVANDEQNKPLDIDLELTRERLEELTVDLVDRTISNVDRILKEAGSTKQQIDEILLVGGQSRMPLVQRKVSDYFLKPPCKGVHPDEAVGIGAAIMAHSLAGTAGDDVTLLDVLPMPIGINKVDGTMHVLFPKNQPLPDYKTRTLTTSKDNQRSIMLRIYQGESQMCAENEMLGTFVFSGIRPAPKGKVQIEVTFHIDSEGILNLTARDKATGQTVESTLKLGKGGVEPLAGKKDEEEKQEAPPPPLPFTMPTSSLAAQLGAGHDHSTIDAHPPTGGRTMTEPTMLADAATVQAELEKLRAEKAEREAASLSAGGASAHGRGASAVVKPLPKADVGNNGKAAKAADAKGEENTDAGAPANGAAEKAPETKPADEKGGGGSVWGRVAGWFKGLFGN